MCFKAVEMELGYKKYLLCYLNTFFLYKHGELII